MTSRHLLCFACFCIHLHVLRQRARSRRIVSSNVARMVTYSSPTTSRFVPFRPLQTHPVPSRPPTNNFNAARFWLHAAESNLTGSQLLKNSLTLLNAKVHHRVHNSAPNRTYSEQTEFAPHLPKSFPLICLPSMHWVFLIYLLPLHSHSKLFYALFYLTCVPHVPPILRFSYKKPNNILYKIECTVFRQLR
jgi:hypothetical protein